MSVGGIGSGSGMGIQVQRQMAESAMRKITAKVESPIQKTQDTIEQKVRNMQQPPTPGVLRSGSMINVKA